MPGIKATKVEKAAEGKSWRRNKKGASGGLKVRVVKYWLDVYLLSRFAAGSRWSWLSRRAARNTEYRSKLRYLGRFIASLFRR